MRDLTGKVAVVTGAASGLGFGIARQLAREGMRVVLADVEVGALDAAVERLGADGHIAIGVPCDVRHLTEVEALRERTIAELGGLHVVCNNAGVVLRKPAWEITPDDWAWVLGVNLGGVINGIRAFVPALVDAGEPAHVVNTSSMAGFLTIPGLAAYTASKRAVVGISETLVADLARIGAPIGVSVLCPGFVATQLGASSRNRPPELGGPEPLPDGVQLPEPDEASVEHVATMTVEAIRTDRLYVFTHPDDLDGVRLRFSAVLEEHGPR